MISPKLKLADIPQRQAYGIALADYGDMNNDVVVLDADVSSSTLTSFFAKRHPARFFNLGVTEASMVDVGVGILERQDTFCQYFRRPTHLARLRANPHRGAYANANVKLIGVYAGISDYKDGPTHFAVNDVAILRSMPNMVVLAPADNLEVARLRTRAVKPSG